MADNGNNRIRIMAMLLGYSIVLSLVCGFTVMARCQSILDAVKQGDAVTVRQMLATGGVQAANTADGNGYTALQFAAIKGRLTVAELLIQSGADVNSHSKNGWTPLHEAASNGQSDLIPLLLKRGAKLDATTPNGDEPLHKATELNRAQALCCLLVAGADIDARNQDGNTPLALAVTSGSIDTARELMAAGADIHSKNIAGVSVKAMAANGSEIYRMLSELDVAQHTEADRANRRQSNPAAIRTSYANWSDPTAKTREVYQWAPSSDALGKEWFTIPLSGKDNAPLHSENAPNKRRFFGSFGSQSVNLELRNLPAHKELAVRFDLLIIGSWTGMGANIEPGTWSLSVADGPTLLHTSFANTCEAQVDGSKPDDFRNLKIQAYPGDYAGDHNPMYTGADEANTLGYKRVVNGDEIPMDALYKIRYTFQHSDADITLSFAGQGLDSLAKESSGIANLEVSVGDLSPIAKSTPAPNVTSHASIGSPVPSVIRAAHKPVSNPAKHSTRQAATRVKKKTGAKPSKPDTTRLHDKKKPLTP